MLPVVEQDGRSTARRILFYSALLIPVSSLPSLLSMSGSIYLFGALLLGAILFYFCLRLASLKVPMVSAQSKLKSRQILQASVIYLPLLFALMIGDAHAR